MTKSRLFSRTLILLFGLAIIAGPPPLFANDSTILPPASALPAIALPGEALAFGLHPDNSTRRFIYGNFGENRGEKALRSFKLSMGGIPGEVGQILSFPIRKPGTTAAFLLGTAALITIDRQTTIFWQDRIEPVCDGIELPPLLPNLPLMSARPNIWLPRSA